MNHLSLFEAGEQGGQGPVVIDPASLYRAFEQVKDERKAVMEALSAPLCPDSHHAGETSRRKEHQWNSGLGQRKEKPASRSNSGLPKGFPVNSTSSEALAHCDGQEVAQAIAQVLVKARAEEKCGNEPSRLQAYEPPDDKLIHTAMDGKTRQGTLHHTKEEQPSVHLLALYECESGIVLAQETVKSKENEITASGARLASCSGERQNPQYRCHAYAKEVVCRGGCL